MLKHYLFVSLRNFRRNWQFLLINIFGLSVGISVMLIVLLHLWFQLSYDKWHSKSERIFRLTMKYDFPNGINSHWARVNLDWINNLPEEMPEVEKLVRFQDYQPRQIKVGDKKFRENYAFTADKEVFEVFDFTLVKGDPKTALREPQSIILTEDIAHKYFGEDDPMGKEVIIVTEGGDNITHVVTGLMQNLPKNTHLPVNLLTSFSGEEARRGWAYTYLLMADSDPTASWNEMIPAIIAKYANQEQAAGISLPIQQISSIHLESHLAREITVNGRISYLYIFGGVGLFVLVMAIINFVNLNTVLSLKHSKPVAIRKILGSSRLSIGQYFITEAAIFSTAAATIAITTVLLVIPYLRNNGLLFIEIIPEVIALSLLLLVLIISYLSSYYPAVFLSGISPTSALKGQTTERAFHSNYGFRNMLVAVQLTICIMLVSGAMVTKRQLEFLVSKNIGISKEQVVALTNIPATSRDKYQTLKLELEQLNGVEAVGACMEVPSREIRDTGIYYVEGMDEDSEQSRAMDAQIVDRDFIRVMGIELIAGRNFREHIPQSKTLSDFEDLPSYLLAQNREYILNETAIKLIGWDDANEALGQQFNWTIGNLSVGQGPIVGVVKDYHQESMRNQVEPIVMFYEPLWLGNILVRVNGNAVPEIMDQIQQEWDSVVPDFSMEYSFVDDLYNKLYQQERSQLQLAYIFSALAVIIAFLGIFSLISFTLKTRIKELAIRRVLGATIGSIVILLGRQYVAITLAGMLIATSVAWWWLYQWLHTFAYRVSLTGLEFLLALIAITLMIFAIISYRAYRSSLRNPVQALRLE